MKHVAKSRFKRAVLEYLSEVEATGEPMVITDRGRPVVQLAPIAPVAPAAETLARLRGCVLRYDDPTEPVAVDWG